MKKMKPLALALLLALATPASAGAGELFGDPERPVDWRKPVLYTAGGLSLQFAALVLSGEADDWPGLGNFKSAFSDGPRRDDDSALYNFVLHPLWGSETYLRAREANFGMVGSFGFSLGASVTWEYLFESWTEHPSTQDLIFTTGIGWMLGELRYRLKQRSSAEADWWIDPIHKGLEHWGVVVASDERGRKHPQLRFAYTF